MIAVSWSTSAADRLPRPFFHVRPGTLHDVEVLGINGARPCARGGCGPGRTGGCAHRPGSKPARLPRPGPSPYRTPSRQGCGRAVPRCGPWAGAGSAPPRPRSTHTPRPPPLASKPAHHPTRAFRGQRGLAASTLAPPPLIRRLGTDPQPVRHLHRAGIPLKHLRGLQPHALTPGPPSSGQATTIWIPHDPGVDPPPGTITQARRPLLAASLSGHSRRHSASLFGYDFLADPRDTQLPEPEAGRP